MEHVNFFNDIVFAYIESIVILFLFVALTGNKRFISENKSKSQIFSALYTTYVLWLSIYLPQGMHTVLGTFLTILILSFITKENIYRTIITFALIMIYLMTIEILISIIIILIFNTDIVTVTKDPYLKLIDGYIIRTIDIITTFWLYKKDINLFKRGVLSKGNIILGNLVFQVAIVGVFFISTLYEPAYKSNIAVYYALLSVIYLLFIMLNILDYKERERILRIQSEFQTQEKHIKNLEHVIDFIRREKHDFANHLNTIHIMSKLGKPDSITKIADYTTKLTHDINASYQFYNTGNDYIDGLLAVKSNVAHEMRITLEANFEAPLSQLEVSDSDLTSIVGNIVDNAFEAVSGKADGEGKIVSISSYVDENKYYLSIANNGPTIPEKVLEKIFESGFSTKTDSKADHGYGLYIVKQMVERNGGKISVSSSEDETVFILDLGVKYSKRLEVV